MIKIKIKEQVIIMTNSNQTEDGQTKIQTRLEDETVWLTQQQMADLFQKSRSTIDKDIKSIYAENELIENNSMKKFGNSDFLHTKPTNYYTLKDLSDAY